MSYDNPCTYNSVVIVDIADVYYFSEKFHTYIYDYLCLSNLSYGGQRGVKIVMDYLEKYIYLLLEYPTKMDLSILKI